MPSTVGSILKRCVAQTELSTRAADVLVQMSLCRSKPLGKRDYHCQSCHQQASVYNSCGQRHCCDCSGFHRIRWLARTQQRLVPQTSYLQIVFTLPDTVGELLSCNPEVAYGMFLKTAARETMRLQQGLNITPGCLAVLHTWNQRLLPHIHAHVLIPCAGIAIEDPRWIKVEQQPELRQGDQPELGRAFRKSIIRRIKRLQKHGKLHFGGKHEQLNDPEKLKQYLDRIAPVGYRVFVQHAPEGCNDPATVVKYLARYTSGGPISDKRIVKAEDGKVTFRVRDNRSAKPGQRKRQVPLTIDELEFTRRWALHVLPKGFVRVRSYGHASHSNCQDYLARCRALLGLPAESEVSEEEELSSESSMPRDAEGYEIDLYGGVSQRCPKCRQLMQCVSYSFRPSWKEILSGPARPAWYDP